MGVPLKLMELDQNTTKTSKATSTCNLPNQNALSLIHPKYYCPNKNLKIKSQIQ